MGYGEKNYRLASYLDLAYNAETKSVNQAKIMTEPEPKNKTNPSELNSVEHNWGAHPEDNFGYATEEERRANRGLEDWELLDKMSESQPLMPWLRKVLIGTVIGVAIFLTFAYGLNYFMHHFGMNLLPKH